MTTAWAAIITAPILAGSIIAVGVGVAQSFEERCMETLCRMEHVRVTAMEQLERDEPLEADFGGDECLGLAASAVDVTVEEWTPTPAPEDGSVELTPEATPAD